jgi:hypothetical protein
VAADLTLAYAALSDIGLRRSSNQDSKAVLEPWNGEQYRRRGWLFLVADGMGAHAAGEMASDLAARHVPPSVSGTPVSAVATNGSAFFGGPTARGSVTIAPVMYSAARTISQATATVAGCAATYTFTTTDARPWTMTYGAGTSAGTFRSCAYETPFANNPDVFPTVTASIDNNNLTGPTAAGIANGGCN